MVWMLPGVHVKLMGDVSVFPSTVICNRGGLVAMVVVSLPEFTANGRSSVVLADVASLPLRLPPAAAASIVNVAVALVELDIATLLTVIPVPADTVIPAAKFVPVSVTLTFNPALPPVGLIEVNVGAPTVTVNLRSLVRRLDIVTVTICARTAAAAPIVIVAVAVVELDTATLVTVIPLPADTVIPAAKFVPVSVTLTFNPTLPLVGLIEVNVGAPTVTVNV